MALTEEQSANLVIMIDTVWMMIGGSMIFFMSAGFAMLEVGSYNAEVTMSVLVKNIVVKLSTALVWWLWGFGIALGEDDGSGFIGTTHYGPKAHTLFKVSGHEVYIIRELFFQWGPCFIAATIAGGAMGERVRMDSYILYTIFMSGWIYPCIVHWGFNPNGWLVTLDTPYVDVGGSGLVHMVGGMSALVGCIIAGKRDLPDPQPHSVPLIILGTLILWFGWYGYNGGSYRITGIESIPIVARILVNCTLAAAGAGISCFVLRRWMNPAVRIDIIPLCNGVLAGLVAISGACANVNMWAATTIGLVAGFVYPTLASYEHDFEIEDPVEAAPLHYGCGLWGVIATGLFHEDLGFFTTGQGHLLGTQTIAAIVITGWVAFWCTICFGGLKMIGRLNYPLNKSSSERDKDLFGTTGYEDLHEEEHATTVKSKLDRDRNEYGAHSYEHVKMHNDEHHSSREVGGSGREIEGSLSRQGSGSVKKTSTRDHTHYGSHGDHHAKRLHERSNSSRRSNEESERSLKSALKSGSSSNRARNEDEDDYVVRRDEVGL